MIRRRDAAFTAIELLVVLLGVALMLAFLIPVLRERHRDSVFAELTAIADGELEADRRGFDLALNTLDDADPDFRKVSIDALGGNSFIRSGATPFFMPPWIFADLEGAAALAVPALVERLGDFDAQVRRAAATTLGNMGKHAAEAVPGLVGAIEDSDTRVQIEAIRALGYLGSDAKITYQLLADREDDPIKEIADAAGTARTRIVDALRHKYLVERADAQQPVP